MMLDIIAGLLEGLIAGLRSAFFPAKTAADQKVVDLKAQQQESENANSIADHVQQESDAQLDADLAKRVRPAADR